MHTALAHLRHPTRPIAVAAERADVLAVRLAAQPGRVLLRTLALDMALAGVFVAIGLLVFGDQALMFRELAPGTFLSFAQLLLIAAAAWAVHRRSEPVGRWHSSFWGLAAIAFLVFAFDEITQSLIFLSHALEGGLGLESTGGFHDLQAVLLTLLFIGVGLVLLPRSLVLLRHARALGLLVVAVLLGGLSQGLDSFAPATKWEFVAEETLKLAAEVFFIAAFLVALRKVLAERASARAPESAASSRA